MARIVLRVVLYLKETMLLTGKKIFDVDAVIRGQN